MSLSTRVCRRSRPRVDWASAARASTRWSSRAHSTTSASGSGCASAWPASSVVWACHRPVGQPLSPSSAWAVLALASGDAAFRDHVAARLSDPDRSRARTRLLQHSLLELLPRLRNRGNLHRYAVGAEALVDILSDARLVLAGPSAARALGWDLPDGSWPVEAYVPEPALVDVVERYALEPDPAGDLVLRSVPEPWPFPAQLRVVPELVAAVDLADGPALDLVELGRARAGRAQR